MKHPTPFDLLVIDTMVAILRNRSGDRLSRSEILDDGMKHFMHDCGLCEHTITGPELWEAKVQDKISGRNGKPRYVDIARVPLCERCDVRWNRNWIKANSITNCNTVVK